MRDWRLPTLPDCSFISHDTATTPRLYPLLALGFLASGMTLHALARILTLPHWLSKNIGNHPAEPSRS